MRSGRPRRRAAAAEFQAVDLSREVIDPRRQSDLAYAAILQALFERRIPVGVVLNQRGLMQKLRLPAQPLRDALRVLEAEGVLTIHARSGIQFLRADAELARSTYEFRALIECAGVRILAARGRSAQLVRLRDAHLALRADVDQEIISEAAQRTLDALDTELHGAMIGVFSNPIVENAARRLDNYVAIIHLDRAMSVGAALGSIREHVAIIEACCDRDPSRADTLLQAHLEAALQRALAIL